MAAQLTSLGKACDVARGSPAVSLLVSVASREQGLSAKLLALDKQLEDHEVAVLELEKQVKVLEEEKEKMVQRMVQMEEQLSEEVLCLNVGLSLEHKLWDWDEVVDRVTVLDEVVEGGCEPLQELSARVERLQKWSQDISAEFCVCQDRVTNLEQWCDELAASL